MSALTTFKSQEEYEEFVVYLVNKYNCTIEEVNKTLHNSQTPREAEIMIKITKAQEGVKAYKIKLPSDEGPECTCESRMLFAIGCHCAYAAWKKGAR